MRSITKWHWRWQPGFVLPGLIALFACTDLFLRLVPIDRFAFRAWEAMVARQALDGPFAPDKRYDNERSSGDLATIGNRPELRQYRRETFTTDAHGFREDPRLSPGGPVRAILTGDSFSVGSGVSDEQTLSVQLGARSGRRVYNAAGGTPARLPDLRAIASRLGLGAGGSGGLVLFEYCERLEVPEMATARSPLYTVLPPGQAVPFSKEVTRVLKDLRVSRLSILAGRFQKAFDVERHDGRVVVRRLRNGEPFLFLREDIERHAWRRPVRVEYFSWLRGELRKDGLDLLVLLVPSKYTVYEPLLQERDPGPRDPQRYLDRLEEGLHGAGVPVVNLTGPLRERAQSDLMQGEYLYFRDDTHWNERGIALAAELVNEAWAEGNGTPGPHPGP